ncbi:sensor histidine kinase [Actinopolymorpha alba]|uniref:sensor histidine kinase n=1 Tax=Actinopolymorpha alba TaxID=533267 RepID=UPI00036E337A|nr:sensor histidine kinase [Actinopolymorpha alba]
MSTRGFRSLWVAGVGLPYGVPALIAVIQVVGTFGASHGQPWRRPVDAVAIALLLLGPAALVFRQRHAVPVLLAVTGVSLVYVLFGYPYGPFVLSFVVALVNAVRRGHRRVAWLAAAGLYAGHLGIGQLLGEQGRPTVVQAVIVAGWTLVILVGAELLRIRHERLEESRRAQAAEAAGRVTEERLRIARELHDVVAHNISLINVQAGVALHLMDANPEQARTALTAIKQASKEALVELRSVLGVLRQVDEPGPRQPAPSLRVLTPLVERTRQAGLDVQVSIEGGPRAIPSSVDVAAYRIIQEALTNVLRHAGARTAVVRVTYADRLLVVDVTDDGVGTPGVGAGSAAGSGGANGSGTGLAGMRERVTALGGRLVAGPEPGGGFRVRAELPMEATA